MGERGSVLGIHRAAVSGVWFVLCFWVWLVFVAGAARYFFSSNLILDRQPVADQFP